MIVEGEEYVMLCVIAVEPTGARVLLDALVHKPWVHDALGRLSEQALATREAGCEWMRWADERDDTDPLLQQLRKGQNDGH